MHGKLPTLLKCHPKFQTSLIISFYGPSTDDNWLYEWSEQLIYGKIWFLITNGMIMCLILILACSCKPHLSFPTWQDLALRNIVLGISITISARLWFCLKETTLASNMLCCYARLLGMLIRYHALKQLQCHFFFKKNVTSYMVVCTQQTLQNPWELINFSSDAKIHLDSFLSVFNIAGLHDELYHNGRN